MDFRLTPRRASAQKSIGAPISSHARKVATALLLFFMCVFNIGCVSRVAHWQRAMDRSAAKISFISWNLRSKVVEPRESAMSRSFQIASLSNRELYHIMQTRPAPDLATISGEWHGINKGVGSAMFGLMQDVKVLEGKGCVTGYNVLVKQVSIKDLPRRGWQPELDPKTCKPKTMGNFVAIAPTCCCEPGKSKLSHTVKLDYTVAENPWYDPSRFLIDQLVAIDDDLLLGRATAKVGSMQVPVAYFVLSRAPQCVCNYESGRLAQNRSEAVDEKPEYSVMAPSQTREIVECEILAEPSKEHVNATSRMTHSGPANQERHPVADRPASDRQLPKS